MNSNAYDNPQKANVRGRITEAINRELDGEEITIVELLGSGVGAEYYVDNVKNLKSMFLIERQKKNVVEFEKTFLKQLQRKTTAKLFCLYTSLDMFLDKAVETIANKKLKPFNVINLDFCGIFKVNALKTNNVTPITKIFSENLIRNNGLIFFTYKIGGWMPPGKDSEYTEAWEDPSVLSDTDEIIRYIGVAAGLFGYKIELLHRIEYKSQEKQGRGHGRASTMLNIGIKVSEIVE